MTIYKHGKASIIVDKKTKERLDKFKIIHQEPYDTVINRALDGYTNSTKSKKERETKSDSEGKSKEGKKRKHISSLDHF